jgi:hypothetical protein
MNDETQYIGRAVGAASDPAPTPKGNRKTAGARFRLFNGFVDFTLRKLSRIEIAVWIVLYRDSRDGIARTGQADIARRIGTSARTVRRAIRQLATRGLLDIVRRGRIGCGPSAYRVRGLIPDPARRTELCPVVTGQVGASTADTAWPLSHKGPEPPPRCGSGRRLKRLDNGARICDNYQAWGRDEQSR